MTPVPGFSKSVGGDDVAVVFMGAVSGALEFKLLLQGGLSS